jgi:hypothetical protein
MTEAEVARAVEQVATGSGYALHGVEQVTRTLWKVRLRCGRCGLFPCLLPTDARASVAEIVGDALREHTRRHLPA